MSFENPPQAVPLQLKQRYCFFYVHSLFVTCMTHPHRESLFSSFSPTVSRFFLPLRGIGSRTLLLLPRLVAGPPVPHLALMAISASINPLFSSARLQVRHKIHKTSHFCAILHLAYENKYILIYTSTIYVASTISCQSIHSNASVYLTSIFKHIRTISALACVIVAVLYIV